MGKFKVEASGKSGSVTVPSGAHMFFVDAYNTTPSYDNETDWFRL